MVSYDGGELWSRSPGVIGSLGLDELVLLHLECDEAFTLEGVAGEIWEMLENPTTESTIIETLAAKYEVSPQTCQEDCRDFLREMQDRGFLESL